MTPIQAERLGELRAEAIDLVCKKAYAAAYATVPPDEREVCLLLAELCDALLQSQDIPNAD